MDFNPLKPSIYPACSDQWVPLVSLAGFGSGARELVVTLRWTWSCAVFVQANNFRNAKQPSAFHAVGFLDQMSSDFSACLTRQQEYFKTGMWVRVVLVLFLSHSYCFKQWVTGFCVIYPSLHLRDTSLSIKDGVSHSWLFTGEEELCQVGRLWLEKSLFLGGPFAGMTVGSTSVWSGTTLGSQKQILHWR